MRYSKAPAKFDCNKVQTPNPALSRCSSTKKSRPSSRIFENQRCDTPDQGGGKPGSHDYGRKNEYSKGFLRPDFIINRAGLRVNQSIINTQTSNNQSSRQATSTFESKRSNSQSKIKPADLKQGIFSNKQSILSETKSKRKMTNLTSCRGYDEELVIPTQTCNIQS